MTKYLLAVHGAPDDVAKVKDVIAGTAHPCCTVHGKTVLA
jgi:hypothetical protein